MLVLTLCWRTQISVLFLLPLLPAPLLLPGTDAGADFTSWQDSQTDYDVLQTAANKGYVEICLKLVEAGAKWQLPKQQRMIGGSVYYAPDILAITVPNLKVRRGCRVLC